MSDMYSVEGQTKSECVSLPRLWKVALGLDTWNAAECQHLLGCQRCRTALWQSLEAIQKRKAVEEELAAGCRAMAGQGGPATPSVDPAQAAAKRRILAAPPGWLAQQPFRWSRAQKEPELFSTEELPEFTFTFEEDPNLKVVRCRHRDGTYWLHLEHSQWPPGTLAQIVLSSDDECCDLFVRYVVMRQGFRGTVTQTLLDVDIPEGEHRFHVAQVGVPGTELVGKLRESFARAREHDPAAVDVQEGASHSAWQLWALAALKQEGLQDELRKVLEEIRDAKGAGGHATEGRSFATIRTAPVVLTAPRVLEGIRNRRFQGESHGRGRQRDMASIQATAGTANGRATVGIGLGDRVGSSDRRQLLAERLQRGAEDAGG